MNLADILIGQAGGGVLGVVGSLATAWVSLKQKKLDNEFALAKADKDLALAQLQGNLKAAELAGDLAKAREVGAASAFTESVAADGRASSGIRWIAGLREFTRPGLTWYFTLLSTFITTGSALGYIAIEHITDPITQFAIVTVLNTTTMMVAWWFGQRQIDKVTIAWGNKSAGASVAGAK